MKLKIKSHASETETIKDVNDRSQLLDLAKDYPAIYEQVESAPSLEDGLSMLAKYLSRHHMDATVIPDRERMRDDFNVSGREPNDEIKNLDDAAKFLEAEDEHVDIPEHVVIEDGMSRH